MGPKFVADFEDIQDSDERAIRMRDAYERVNHLLSELGILWRPAVQCNASTPVMRPTYTRIRTAVSKR